MYAQFIPFNDITFGPQNPILFVWLRFFTRIILSLFCVAILHVGSWLQRWTSIGALKIFWNYGDFITLIRQYHQWYFQTFEKMSISLLPTAKHSFKQIMKILPDNTTTKSNKEQRILPFILE